MEKSKSQFTGRILLDRIRDTRPIRSFIQKRLSEWLHNHGLDGDELPDCRVALNRHGAGHFFTCEVEVHTQQTHWKAVQTADDLQQAVLSALHHLHPQAA